MKKKIFLSFRTLIFLSLILLLCSNVYNHIYYSTHTIIFDVQTPIRNFIFDLPSIFFSVAPPLYLCIIFTINIIAIIFYPLIKKFLYNKNFLCSIFSIINLVITSITIIYLALNYIDFSNGNLWFFDYFSYNLTYFLFLLYFLSLSLHIYSIFHNFKLKYKL